MKKLKLFGLGLTLSAIFATSAFAAPSAHAYHHYKLSANCANRYTGVHDKETSADFITNEVTKLSKTDSVNMWVANTRHQVIGEIYEISVGQSVAMRHRGRNGSQICMGMENATCTDHEAFVWGYVNFR